MKREREGEIMENLLQLHRDFSKKGVLISFNGSLSNSIIEEIGNAIKQYLHEEKREKGIISDIFSVYIEQTQNIRNYIAFQDIDESHRSSIILISSTDGLYHITSGNSIRRSDVESLKQKMDHINTLDKDGLKQYHKEQRRKVREPDAKTAGLGLIDIARKSQGGLLYRFDSLDEDFDFFSLQVTVQGV